MIDRRVPRLAVPAFCAGLLAHAAATSPDAPGTVISYSPPATAIYIGSPSLAKLADGTLVACHDEFGGGSSQNSAAITRVFRSTDAGRTWSPAAVIQGAFWSTLFVHRDALHLLGTTHQYGNAVIRRSTDGGFTWTTPASPATGLLASDGNYHCAPMPVLVHNGRLWRAMERRMPATGWGTTFRAGVLSIPADADLLDASRWTISGFLPSDPSWLDAKFGGWLEGNVVARPSGDLVNLLRVDHPGYPEKTAITRIAPDGSTLSFDPSTGFTDLPGGSKKFTIRHDPVGNRYWTLATLVPPALQSSRHPASTRHSLHLMSSADLFDWRDEGRILHHPDVTRHGFQYADWCFDGDDLIAVSRTAFDDASGGAANFHDANYLTFHRLRDFRSFANRPLPGPWVQAFFGNAPAGPEDDPDGDGFTNRHECLAGSNPIRRRSTPGNARSTARIALAGSSGVDEYRVVADGKWTFVRQITPTHYQSIIHHGGLLYGSGFSRIDRIDPESGGTVSLATRNSGTALAAGWTQSDSQQLAIGPDGRLYFSTAFGANSGEGVFRLNPDGSGFERFIARTGGTAPANWDLNNARGIAWLGDRLAVSSRATTSSTSRPVHEFAANGRLIRTLRTDLAAPQGLLVDDATLRIAGYPGTLTAVDPDTTARTGLVSGLPNMICMSAVEIHGEIHVVTYQHGIWRQRETSSLTQAFVPANTQHTSIAVIPGTDPYERWARDHPELADPSPAADPDHDGSPNRLEYLLGTDPLDGVPHFRLTLAGNRLSFPTAPGACFTVFSSTDLKNWSTIEAVVFGEPGAHEASMPLPHPPSHGRRFYRVAWQP